MKNIAAQTSEGKDYFGRLGEVSGALERAKLELREAEEFADALKRQIVGEGRLASGCA